MSAGVERNISYFSRNSQDPLRQFDIYWPQQSGDTKKSLLCFIHGGAWRSEDKRDHETTARNLVKATGCPVAVPNYRLTPTQNINPGYHHPMHANDMLQFLYFIRAWEHDTESIDFDPNSLILLGHSCSAHMLASAFLDYPDFNLNPSQELLDSVKAIIISEGIYDIDALLEQFPTYRSLFIESAFGASDTYSRYSVLNYPLRPRSTSSSAISWLILHSKGDTLVNQGQSESMFEHLNNIAGVQNVTLNADDLKQEHNDILATEIYANLVKEFITKSVNLSV